MYQLKTQQSNENVLGYLEKVCTQSSLQDCLELIDIFSEATGEAAKMWGTSIIGFGSYHYKYESGHEGDMCLTGFAPRSTNITIYITMGLSQYEDILKSVGKYKSSGKSCMQIKKLSDVNTKVLKKLIEKCANDVKKKYPEK